MREVDLFGYSYFSTVGITLMRYKIGIYDFCLFMGLFVFNNQNNKIILNHKSPEANSSRSFPSRS